MSIVPEELGVETGTVEFDLPRHSWVGRVEPDLLVAFLEEGLVVAAKPDLGRFFS